MQGVAKLMQVVPQCSSGPEELCSRDAHWLTSGRFALILAALICAAFPQVVTGLHSFVYRDFGLFGYPLAHYHRESFWRGEVPLWNPYNNFGIPFLAQWGTMVLYPPSLVYLLFPLPWSLGAFCLLHLFFGGIGMYVLARRWTGNSLAAGLAGIGFTFNGLTLNCLMWPNYTASLAWMPWVVWAVSRACREGGRWIIYAALIGALQMLSGTPEVILFTWLVVLGILCCETRAPQVRTAGLRLAAIIGLVSALSAAQLLPFFQLLHHSTRSPNFAQDQWPIAAWGWANIFVPLFRTYRTDSGVHFQDGQGLTSSYYPGLALMALALLALRWQRQRCVWFLWLAVFASFVLAMGQHTPVYDWVRKTFPALGFMRYPSKFLFIPLFAWPLLAAFGWVTAAEHAGRWRWHIAMLGAIALVVGGIVVFAKIAPHPGEDWTATLRNGIERVVLLGIVAGLMWWALRGGGVKPLGTAAILLVVWFDFLKHVPAQNPTAVPHALTSVVPHLEQMQPRPRLGESRALLTLTAMQRFHSPGTSNLTETHLVHRSGLYDNCNLVDAIPKADGFFALYIREERDIHFRLYETDDRPRPALGRFLGISQVSGATNVLTWEARSGFLPFISAGQQPIFADRNATLAGLIATNFVPEKFVYLPPAAENEVRVVQPQAARVISAQVGRHKMEAEVEASSPSVVIVSQIDYPAWRAYVNGKVTRMWRANHAFQAVYIGPGKHKIQWHYRDTWFFAGGWLSLATLITCGGGLLASRMCTRRALIRDKPPAVQDDAAALAA
jgi:hypothetical protein